MTLAVPSADLAQRYLGGETVTELAERYGCHRGTVLYRLKQSGVWGRKRARVNARKLLTTYKPTLLVLLAQVESALKAVRAEFAAEGVVRSNRKKYLDRIARLEAQIEALEALTNKS